MFPSPNHSPQQVIPLKSEEGELTPSSAPSDIKNYFRAITYSYPCIILPHEIQEQTLTNFIQAVHTCPDPDKMVVYCNGYGGDGAGALGIVDFMESLKSRINFIGVVTGGAYSAHSIIFAGCTQRFIGKNSFLGIHGVSSGAWGFQRDMDNVFESHKFFNKRVASIFSGASKLSTKEWLRELNKHNTMCKIFGAKTLVEEFKMAEYYTQALF